jgi:hypothetical protein
MSNLLSQFGAGLGRCLQQPQQDRVHTPLGLRVVAFLIAHVGEDMMATPAYLKAYRDYLARQPDFGSLPAMEQEFYLGSDRPAVILQVSNVENILQSVLEAKMRNPMPKDVRDRLFEGLGPLASFSAKILVGFAFNLFGPVFRHDLDLMRELRNGFAHARHPMTLSTPEIAGVVAQLRLPDQPGHAGPPSYYQQFDIEIAADASPHAIFSCLLHRVFSAH